MSADELPAGDDMLDAADEQRHELAPRSVMYEACFRGLTFGQAQAMYRTAVDLGDDERMYGDPGMCWSGVIPGNDTRAGRGADDRTITIQPMVGEAGRPSPPTQRDVDYLTGRLEDVEANAARLAAVLADITHTPQRSQIGGPVVSYMHRNAATHSEAMRALAEHRELFAVDPHPHARNANEAIAAVRSLPPSERSALSSREPAA